MGTQYTLAVMAYRLGIIGGGNMGSAIVRGGIAAGVLTPDEVIIAEIDSDRRRSLSDVQCGITDDPRHAASTDVIVLAVKPQIFPDVARAIGPLPASTVVISIMAGLNSRVIRSALGGAARVIRVMPNMPCQIGEGMAAIAQGEGSAPGDEALAVRLFGAIGRTVIVDESQMYAVTAVSGSGPAYVFLLAEAMQQAAEQLGLEASVAAELVEQTIRGAGRLLSESDLSAEHLRKAVTSPGGTTAAALDVFTKRQFSEIVIEALTAACDRGRELDRA